MACSIVLQFPVESLGAVDMLLPTTQVLSKKSKKRSSIFVAFFFFLTFPWDKHGNSKSKKGRSGRARISQGIKADRLHSLQGRLLQNYSGGCRATSCASGMSWYKRGTFNTEPTFSLDVTPFAFNFYQGIFKIYPSTTRCANNEYNRVFVLLTFS